jgi:phosphatidylinositol alpha-1,6-mannosyltransferase
VKIFALLTDGPGCEGGIARYNEALLCAFKVVPAAGVTVLPRRSSLSPAAKRCDVTILRPIAGKLALVFRIISLAARGPRHDVVFCGHINMAPLARFLAWAWSAKLWVQMHGIDCWESPGYFVRSACDSAELITCVSRYTRRKVLDWSGIPRERVRVLPNTMPDVFETALKKSVTRAGRKALTDAPLRLLTVSRLSAAERYKGHETVIDALVILANKRLSVEYVVAGDGDDRDRLVEYAANSGAESIVRFVGRVTDDELSDLYDAADVFVLPSTGEGFGIVFLEALQRGCAVIAGGADGSVDPLRDGADGYLLPPRDPQALSNLLLALAQTGVPGGPWTNVFSKRHFDTHVDRLLAHLR